MIRMLNGNLLLSKVKGELDGGMVMLSKIDSEATSELIDFHTKETVCVHTTGLISAKIKGEQMFVANPENVLYKIYSDENIVMSEGFLMTTLKDVADDKLMDDKNTTVMIIESSTDLMVGEKVVYAKGLGFVVDTKKHGKVRVFHRNQLIGIVE